MKLTAAKSRSVVIVFDFVASFVVERYLSKPRKPPNSQLPSLDAAAAIGTEANFSNLNRGIAQSREFRNLHRDLLRRAGLPRFVRLPPSSPLPSGPISSLDKTAMQEVEVAATCGDS